jgi:hypothetical protein
MSHGSGGFSGMDEMIRSLKVRHQTLVYGNALHEKAQLQE